MNVKTITTHICGKCGNEYGDDSMRSAVECCLPPLKLPYKVGQIVTTGQGFGWADGDRRWIVNPQVHGDRPLEQAYRVPACKDGNGNCFNSCCCMIFYYVITEIERLDSPNGAILTLHTKAMTGASGYASSTHSAEQSWGPKIVKRTLTWLRRDAAKLLAEFRRKSNAK